MRHAMFLPGFGPLSDPRNVVDVARRAEASGWDGLFLWDHVQYSSPADEVGDPWVTLGAVAQATERLRIGTMITPLPRRRPQVVARQVTTLDVLSQGRVVLGVGIGGDGARELSAFAEETDPKVRGAMLDEELELLTALWSGQRVEHDGQHHVADDVQFLPRPVQQPHPPLWAAARFGSSAPVARAARLDGIFPIGLERPNDLRTLLDELEPQRLDPDAPFDVCVNLLAGTDPEAWAEAGATWAVTHLGPYRIDLAEVQRMADGPPPAWPTDLGWA